MKIVKGYVVTTSNEIIKPTDFAKMNDRKIKKAYDAIINSKEDKHKKELVDSILLKQKYEKFSKQWRRNVFYNVAEQVLKKSPSIHKMMQSYIDKVINEGKAIHIPSISIKYQEFIILWGKQNGLRKKYDFLISPKVTNDVTFSQRTLYAKIKKYGLPITLTPPEDGLVDMDIVFFVLSKNDEWVYINEKINMDNCGSTEKEVLSIVGARKISFIPNFCHYRKRKDVGIWEVYLFLRRFAPEYLKEQKIFYIKDFLRYILIRNHNMMCEKLVRVKEVIQGTNMYELEKIVKNQSRKELSIKIARLINQAEEENV